MSTFCGVVATSRPAATALVKLAPLGVTATRHAPGEKAQMVAHRSMEIFALKGKAGMR